MGERKSDASGCGGAGPIHEFQVLPSLAEPPKPTQTMTRLMGEPQRHYVQDITGPQTSGDGQLDFPDQLATFEFRLQFHQRNRRISFLDAPTATAVADEDLSDNFSFGN